MVRSIWKSASTSSSLEASTISGAGGRVHARFNVGFLGLLKDSGNAELSVVAVGVSSKLGSKDQLVGLGQSTAGVGGPDLGVDPRLGGSRLYGAAGQIVVLQYVDGAFTGVKTNEPTGDGGSCGSCKGAGRRSSIESAIA